MKINVKKTKVMMVSRAEEMTGMQRSIMLNGTPLEQAKRFKYLESWITDDAKSDEDIRTRVGMSKAAFWQNKELMRRNTRFKTKMKILNCFVFSILNYGCESWIWNKAMRKKVNAFEMWCYCKMPKISWKDRIRNVEILRRLQTTYHFVEDMMKRKMRYAVHVLRGSSGLTHLQILEGYVEGKRKLRAPRRVWMKDIMDWTGLRKYIMVKRAAEERASWRLIVVNL